MPTAALYIHIPFCEKRCVYCDFYTVAGQRHRIPDYLKALTAEMEFRRAETFWRASRFSTIFFGGGTPSLLSPQQLMEILDAAYSSFNFDKQVEITLEGNPGTVSPKRLADYRRVGINRLSLGIQSFDPAELQMLDRIHSPEQAVECALAARQAGFEKLSFDLIFALPGQTLARWEATLQHAVELEPNHISAYNLIV
jgi:oxygen-independent coproporphyrinogen-3 oxidase